MPGAKIKVSVTRQNIQNLYPLTPLQEGLLFHALLDSGTDAYFQQVVWDLVGEIDGAAVEAAWVQVVERHDVLRTVFSHQGTDRSLQIVLRRSSFAVETYDFSAMDPAEKEAAVAEAIAADRRKPFDLAHGPLLRVTLFQLTKNHWRALWSHHHILLDGWSVGIVLADWALIYQALRQGRVARLAPPIPWSRYIKWLENRQRDDGLAYWRAYVDDFATATPLPILALDSSAEDDGRRESALARLSPEKAQSLGAWAARHHTTAAVAVQALWAILLAHHSGRDEVLFGAVVSGRAPEVEGIEGMVGNFVNSIPVRLRLTPDSAIREVLAAARADSLASEPHQLTPLARIQAASPLRGELIGSLIAYENYPLDARLEGAEGWPDLGFKITGARTIERTHYPLAAQFLPGDGLHIRIIYRPDWYSAAQIEALLHHFAALVDAAVSDDGQAVGRLRLESRAERVALVEDPNRAALPLPNPAASVVALMTAQWAAHPERLVVEGDGRSLTGQDLDRDSAALARQLKATFALGPDDRVGLLAGRDTEAILGLVAILRAGAAYVPLDPESPAERLTDLVARSGCRLVLADRANLALARDFLGVPVQEILGSVRESAGGEEADRDLPLPSPHDLAYVIHTSGSTGEPKPVAIEHHSLVNLVAGLDGLIYHALPAPRRIALLAPFVFDASVKQIFAALCGGHTLVVANADIRRDAAGLPGWFQAQRIDIADTTPTLLAAILQAGGAEGLRRQLTHLLIGGEPLSAALTNPLAGLAIYNLYGPTECCVDATAQRAKPGATGALPIGKPLPGQRIYLLDEAWEPVPLGSPGEIVIGGLGVARGYLGRADLTAERFFDDPFVPGGRVYRTGDRGRWLADGTLVFLGRADGQIKLRGYRIEVGEIEAQLDRLPGIAGAAVLVENQSELAAVVVTSSAQDIAGLRRALGRVLPDYLIPTRWYGADSLPLTGNGKIDRGALAALLGQLTPLPSGGTARPAGSPLEEKLLLLWQELLGVSGIGIDDNYFALGGDSIKAITLVSRLQREGLVLVLKDLFAHPTIAELAPRLRQAAPKQTGPKQAGTVEQVTQAPLTPIQARLLEGLTRPPARFNQTVLLKSAVPLDAAALEQALTAVIAHHDSLRLAFTRSAGVWSQSLVPVPVLRIETIDLRNGPDKLTLHADGIQGELEPASGKLLAAALYRLEDGDRLLLAVHHLAIDAVSWRVLLGDLTLAYRSLRNNEPVLLPPATSYLAYAGQLAALDLEPERAYWRALAQAGAPLWPGAADNPDIADLEIDAATIERALSPEVTAILTSDGLAIYRTNPEDLLATALLRALHRWGGIERVRLLLEGHGRDLDLAGLDLGRAIGWFTAAFPLDLTLPADRDPGYQIRSIKEQFRATPGGGAGYGLLRWMRSDGEALAPAALGAVGFNYLGQVGQAVAAEGFTWDERSTGRALDPSLPRRHELEFSALVLEGRLRLGVRYGARRQESARIEQLAEAWATEAALLAEHLSNGTATAQVTPSDLTYSAISLDELESLLS